MPDHTLISMAEGGPDPHYAISMISMASVERRSEFFAVADLLAASMGHAFRARPHWGKICPLTREEADRLYPRLSEFRSLRRRWDPDGRFLNDWSADVFS